MLICRHITEFRKVSIKYVKRVLTCKKYIVEYIKFVPIMHKLAQISKTNWCDVLRISLMLALI